MNKTATTLLSLFFLFLFSDSLFAQIDREAGMLHATRSEVIGQHGMVASSQPLAAQIGLDILKQGGNAIDAAIATNAATGLMEPTGNGLGGDLFAIIWHEESQQLYAINASGRSPLSLSYDDLMAELNKIGEDDIPPYHLLSVSVPGAVDGWFQLHDRFGSLDMSTILADPIMYAEEGFPVSEAISAGWQRSAPFLSEQPGALRKRLPLTDAVPGKEKFLKILTLETHSVCWQNRAAMRFTGVKLPKKSTPG